MSSFADYTEDRTLDFWFKANSLSTTAPTTVYVGLATSADSAGDTLANLEANTQTDEVSGNGYSRQSVTFASASGGAISTNATVTFTASGGNWGTITHVAIFDAATSGEIIAAGSLSSSKVISDGDSLQIASGNLTVTLA
jgi:hypothetical protein